MRLPECTNLDYSLSINEKDCEQYKINSALRNLKAKHWVSDYKLARYYLKNKKSSTHSERPCKAILKFFKQVHCAYKTEHPLSIYAKHCYVYWKMNRDVINNRYQEELKVKKLTESTKSLRRLIKAYDENTKAITELRTARASNTAIKKQRREERFDIPDIL